jgi:hypothetical protein
MLINVFFFREKLGNQRIHIVWESWKQNHSRLLGKKKAAGQQHTYEQLGGGGKITRIKCKKSSKRGQRYLSNTMALPVPRRARPC